MTLQEQGCSSTSDAAFAGAITSVKAGIVTGWVENADPKRALSLFIGRRRVATTHQRTAVGTRSEFAFDARGCPPDLLTPRELVIDVAILGETANRFASIKIASDSFFRLQDVPAASKPCPLEGCIDGLTPALVRGWVHDMSRPERQLDLFIFLGERYLSRYAADQPRPDLAATGRGHGNFGFEIPLQEATGAVTVIAGDPEFWRIPVGAHAVTAPGSIKASLLRPRDLPGSVEAFARALTTTEPFPKKEFILDKVKQGAMPDAFSADYVALALECMRQDMVATGEAMKGDWRSRLRTWAKMRVIGLRIRRLEELAAAIAEGPRLLEVAAKRRKSEDG